MKFDIVFEGGGAKGFGFIGALKAFEQHKHEAERLIGTSAGAVIATLLAAGYSADRMKQLVVEKITDGKHERSRFSTFLDAPDPTQFSDAALQDSELSRALQHFPVLEPTGGLSQHLLLKIPWYAHLFSLLEFGGWYVGESFTSWLQQRLDDASDGMKFSDCTLQQFHEITNKDLSLIASDTSVGEMMVLNHRTAPDCPIVWAVRMSMSFPFIWQEVTGKKSGARIEEDGKQAI
jgi:NTE family protein